MQILSEVSRPYVIESLSSPTGISHFWLFDSHMLDFRLEGLEYLEETIGPTITLRIQNVDIQLPASWNILAVDMETYTVDSILVSQAATFDHQLLLFSPNDSKLVTATARVVDYQEKMAVVHPSVPKATAMIHPAGTETVHGKFVFYGIVCGPHDLHRWVGQKTVGDILG